MVILVVEELTVKSTSHTSSKKGMVEITLVEADKLIVKFDSWVDSEEGMVGIVFEKSVQQINVRMNNK